MVTIDSVEGDIASNGFCNIHMVKHVSGPCQESKDKSSQRWAQSRANRALVAPQQQTASEAEAFKVDLEAAQARSALAKKPVCNDHFYKKMGCSRGDSCRFVH